MRRFVWLAILLIAAIGSVAQAEMTVSSAPLTSSTDYTSTGIDAYTRGQYAAYNYRTATSLEIRNNSSSTRISIPFMRFDLSEVGNDNKLNEAIFNFTISNSYKGLTRTYDVWGLNDTGTSTDAAGDMWDASLLTQTYAVDTLGWYTIYSSGGYYTSYTMNSSLWTRLGTIVFTVSSGDQTTSFSSTTTNLNLDSFLAADTNNLITLAITPFYNSNNWHYIFAYDNGSNYPTITFPHAYSRGSSNPSPAEDAIVTDMTDLTFTWNTFDVDRYELWLGTKDANELNYDTQLTNVTTIEVDEDDEELSYTLTESLSAPKTYTWVLAGWIYDANGLPYSEDPNYVSVYQFQTVLLPVAIADPDPQYVLPGETATFTAQFECAGTIDSFTWYKENGTADTALDPEDSDITVTSSNDGTIYTCTLTIDNVETADGGEYYCLASNTGGTDSTGAAKLIVKRLIAQYQFEENANDETGNNNGTLVGSPSFVDGIDGKAMLFSESDYVTLPSGFACFDAGLTFSVWAKPTSNPYYGRFIELCNGTPSDNILLSRDGGSGKIIFRIYSGTSTTLVCAISTDDGVLTEDEWQHITVTMDEDGNVVIYKDGVSSATGTGTLPVEVTRTINYIGMSPWSGDEGYCGYMDDVRIYNYGLDEDTANQLYADVAGNYCRSSLTYDYNDDCIFDITDMQTFAATWLDCGYWPECPH